MVVCNLCNCLKIGDIVLRVSDALDVDSLSLIINCLGKILSLVSDHKPGIDAQSREEDFQLVVGSAIQVGCRYNVVPGMCKSCNCHELSCLSRASCDGRNPTLQGCHSLFEDIDRGLRRESSQLR